MNCSGTKALFAPSFFAIISPRLRFQIFRNSTFSFIVRKETLVRARFSTALKQSPSGSGMLLSHWLANSSRSVSALSVVSLLSFGHSLAQGCADYRFVASQLRLASRRRARRRRWQCARLSPDSTAIDSLSREPFQIRSVRNRAYSSASRRLPSDEPAQLFPRHATVAYTLRTGTNTQEDENHRVERTGKDIAGEKVEYAYIGRMGGIFLSTGRRKT